MQMLIYKLDRLTRSVKDLGTLIETFDKSILWAVQMVNELDPVVHRAEVGTYVAGLRGGNGHD